MFNEELNQNDFNKIYNEHKSIVYNTALSYLQNIEEAEEITQDVFIEMNQSYKNFRGESTIKTWLYKITINKSIDLINYKKRKKRFAFISNLFHEESNEPLHQVSDFNHPGVIIENKEKAAILFKAIDLLPANQKTAFILARIEGINQKEISKIMDTSVGAIESLLSRAKENLKKNLENYYKIK